MKIRLKKHILAIRLFWIDRLDPPFAPRVPIVERGARRASERIIRIEIPNVGEATVAAAWATSEMNLRPEIKNAYRRHYLELNAVQS